MASDVFQLADYVVCEISNGTCHERRKTRDACRAMLPQQLLCHAKDVVGYALTPAAPLDRNLALNALHPHVRSDSKEGVAPNLLTSFNRLQEEGMGLLLGNGQEGGNRGQQVGTDRFDHGDQRG